jgi:hypothetical protein
LAFNGTDTVLIRVDGDAGIDIPAPLGLFDVFGLGSQFDTSNPYTEGYQLLPRSNADIVGVVGTYSFENIGITSIFPNPASNAVYISGDAEIRHIAIFDVTGRMMNQLTNQGTELRINVQSLTPGVYFLKATTDLGTGVTQLIKK